MYAEIFVRYLHFISIFAVVSAVVAEHLLIKPQMTRQELHRMSIIDMVYGIGAILLVAAGLILWFGVGKPAEFYTKNGIFHMKVTLAIIMGIISLKPTIFFLKNRKKGSDELIDVPKSLVWMIRVELLILFSLPLLASLMARGVGAF